MMRFFDDFDATSPCFAMPGPRHGRGSLFDHQGYGYGDVIRKQKQIQQQQQMERYQEQQMCAEYARQMQARRRQMEEEEEAQRHRQQQRWLMQQSNPPFGFQHHRHHHRHEDLIRQQRHKAAVEKQRRHAAGRLRLTNASRNIQRAFRAHQRRGAEQKHAAAAVIQEWLRVRHQNKAARVITRAFRGFPLITRAKRQLHALQTLAGLTAKVSAAVQDHTERLASASTPKKQERSWKQLEDDLMRVQLAVDGCATQGSNFVRQRRKASICLAQRHIDAIDKELAFLKQDEQEMEM